MAKESKDKKAIGKTFMERVLERLPAEKRGDVQSLLLADEVLDLAGEGVLAKEDYSVKIQEAQALKANADTHKRQLDDWWAKELPVRAELREKIAKLEGGRGGGGSDDPDPSPKPAPVTLPPDLIRKTDLDAAINQGLADVATLTTLAGRHQLEFGEALNVHELIAHAVQTGRPVANGGYDSYVGERRREREEQKRKKELQEAEERGAKKERERAAAERGGEFGAGPLAPSFAEGTLRGLNLKPEEKDQKFGVDAAVRGMHQRRQAGGSTQ